MAQLRILDEYAPGLEQIASLPDEVVHDLTSVLALSLAHAKKQRLMSNQWRQIVEGPDLEDQFS
jgi:hypothetical protein